MDRTGGTRNSRPIAALIGMVIAILFALMAYVMAPPLRASYQEYGVTTASDPADSYALTQYVIRLNRRGWPWQHSHAIELQLRDPDGAGFIEPSALTASQDLRRQAGKGPVVSYAHFELDDVLAMLDSGTTRTVATNHTALSFNVMFYVALATMLGAAGYLAVWAGLRLFR